MRVPLCLFTESCLPNHRTTEPPNHRTTEPPNHRTTEPPNHLAGPDPARQAKPMASTTITQMPTWRRLPIGVEFNGDGEAHARVWAPARRSVELVTVRG